MADNGAPADQETRVSSGTGRRRWLIGVVIVVVVVLAVWAIAAMTARGASNGAGTSAPAGPSSSASGSAPSSSSPTPGETSDAPDANASEDPGAFPELPPVAPDEPGQAPGLEVTLQQFESVTGEVVVPGEVQAAAVRVTVQITNAADTSLDLNLVVMSAYMGEERDPAETYQQPGGVPFSGSLDPGATATGVYLFRIPDDRRSDVTFVVDYRGGEPAITWRGAIPEN